MDQPYNTKPEPSQQRRGAARFGHVPVIKALLDSKAQLHRRLKGAGGGSNGSPIIESAIVSYMDYMDSCNRWVFEGRWSYYDHYMKVSISTEYNWIRFSDLLLIKSFQIAQDTVEKWSNRHDSPVIFDETQPIYALKLCFFLSMLVYQRI